MFSKKNIDTAFKASIPFIIGYIPTSFICGVLLQSIGFSTLQTVLMTGLVYAGGAQFAAASMITSNASILSIVISTFIICFRNSLYSLSISTFVEEKSIAKLMLMGHFTTDATYAVNYERYSSGKWSDDLYIVLGIITFIYWVLGGLLGAVLGDVIDIPQDIASFSLVAMFIVLAVLQANNRKKVIVGIFSFFMAILVINLYSGSFNIIIVALLGAMLGYILDLKGEKND